MAETLFLIHLTTRSCLSSLIVWRDTSLVRCECPAEDSPYSVDYCGLGVSYNVDRSTDRLSTFRTRTVMSSPHRSHLPPESLDEIVDLLYNKREILKQCSLVSRSWIPRARKHLFADINFVDEDDIEAWRKRFPDPTRFPAHHTRTMRICCAEVVTTDDVQEVLGFGPFLAWCGWR